MGVDFDLPQMVRGPVDPVLWLLDVVLRGDIVRKCGYESPELAAFDEACAAWWDSTRAKRTTGV